MVPEGVYSLKVEAFGAQGGAAVERGVGGLGGYISTTLVVTPGQRLYVYVGGAGDLYSGGYNGGGNPAPSATSNCYVYPAPGGGGGATDVRTSVGDLTSRLVVAAGGGGDGYDGWDGAAGGIVGGYGGGATGVDGGIDDYYAPASSEYNYGGGGGTKEKGGVGGLCCRPDILGNKGSAGDFGIGGDGNSCGGGGGGGWYGGGGGGASGGGGGSSYAVSGTFDTYSGRRIGNGKLRFEILK